MKSILPFFLLFGVLGFSQQTFNINWQQGVNGSAANLSIAAGDTVTWTWANSSSHDVTSKPGSAETFSSQTVSQQGFQYSYTFNVVGENPYECSIHPGSMFGTITVNSTMSVEDRFKQNLKLFPTTVDTATSVQSLYEIQNISVYSVNGAIVFESVDVNSSTVDFNFENLNSGVYFMKLTSQEGQESTLRFIKN